MQKKNIALISFFLAPVVLIALVVGVTIVSGLLHPRSDGLDEERESLGKKLNVPEHYRMSVMKVMESEAPLKPGEIVGRYNGNTETAPTSTEFSLNSKNVLVGHYSSTWEGSTYEGMLDHPLIGSDHDIAFIWHDKFGSGPVHFVFNDADNAFWGDWKTITVAKNLPLPYRLTQWLAPENEQHWTGVKGKASAETNVEF